MAAVPALGGDVKSQNRDKRAGAVHEIIETVCDDGNAVAGRSNGEFEKKKRTVSDDSQNAGPASVIYAHVFSVNACAAALIFHIFTVLSERFFLKQ